MSKKDPVTVSTANSLAEQIAEQKNVPTQPLAENEKLLEGVLDELKTGSKEPGNPIDPVVTDEHKDAVAQSTETDTVILVDVGGVKYSLPEAVANEVNNLRNMRASSTQKYQAAASIQKSASTLEQQLISISKELINTYCESNDVPIQDFIAFAQSNPGSDVSQIINEHKLAMYEGKIKLSKPPQFGKFVQNIQSKAVNNMQNDLPVKKITAAEFLQEFMMNKK